MCYFDINQYYDAKNSCYKGNDAERDILDYLIPKASRMFDELNRILKNQNKLNFKDNKIQIKLDPTTEKLSKYNVKIDEVINAFKKYTKNNDDDQTAKGCSDELDKIKKAKGTRPSSGFLDIYDRFKRENIENIFAEDVISETDRWIKEKVVAGEFYESGNKKYGIRKGTIVLYLKVICNHSNNNSYLLEILSHEVFHAYHWLSFGKKVYSSWHNSSFQIDTVKEGLASFYECIFIESIDNTLANNLIDSLSKHNMKHYPYSALNLIKDIDTFILLFYMSIDDFGVTYNYLLNLNSKRINGEINRYKHRQFEVAYN